MSKQEYSEQNDYKTIDLGRSVTSVLVDGTIKVLTRSELNGLVSKRTDIKPDTSMRENILLRIKSTFR